MPEKSGVRFYREMREDPDLAGVPIVIVTGIQNPWASPEGSGTIQDFLSKRKRIPPPDGFFEKPVDRDAYLARVAEIVGG
jgi:CheY-like chemotaxis protein